MSKSVLALVTCLGFTGAAAQAATVVIDFDTSAGGAIASGTVLTTQYAGVTFSGTEDGSSVGSPTANSAFASEHGGAPVSGNALYNLYAGDSRADYVTISFDSAVSAISFDFIPFGGSGSQTTIEAYGAGGLLASLLAGGPSTSSVNFNFTGLEPLTGVTSIVIGQPSDSWVWGLDNLTYDTAAPVPLPASLPLLLAALGGAGLVSRRRKRG